MEIKYVTVEQDMQHKLFSHSAVEINRHLSHMNYFCALNNQHDRTNKIYCISISGTNILINKRKMTSQIKCTIPKTTWNERVKYCRAEQNSPDQINHLSGAARKFCQLFLPLESID